MNKIINQKKKVALVVTSVLMVKFFLVPHIKSLCKYYNVTLILKNDYPNILRDMNLGVRVVEIPIERKISLFKDLLTLFKLTFLLKKEKFDLVHTITPKAGLLGIVASWLVRCPKRVHTFQGEVWVTKSGIYRILLKYMDWLVATLATSLTIVSKTEREFLINEGIIKSDKSKVLANGSITGVDLERFYFNIDIRNRIRCDLSIKGDDVVFLYVGRLNHDKGIAELFSAFELLIGKVDKVRLLVVGVDEDGYFSSLLEQSGHLKKYISTIEYTAKPEDYMMASDVLVLPSHREGFGVVVIESAAVGIPSIGSDIYGIRDAIDAGTTGLLFNTKDVNSLCDAMKKLSEDETMRVEMGKNARHRVEELFNQDVVVGAMSDYYHELLK